MALQGIGTRQVFEAWRSTWPVFLHEGALDMQKVYHLFIGLFQDFFNLMNYVKMLARSYFKNDKRI